MSLSDMSESDLRAYMQGLANIMTSITPDGSGFVVLIFEDTKYAQYVSNGTREDVISAMRECADRLERRQDNPR